LKQPQFMIRRLLMRPVLLLGLIPSLALLAVIKAQDRASSFELMQDPSTVTDSPFYIGAVSSLGIVLWSFAAAACLFAWLVRGQPYLKGVSLFLLASGLASCALLLDDLFLAHEHVIPYYLEIPQKGVVAVYLLIGLVYLAVFRKNILAGPAAFLLLAFGLFAISSFLDTHVIQMPDHDWWEDGTKFLGITSWLIFFGERSRQAVYEGLEMVGRRGVTNGLRPHVSAMVSERDTGGPL